MELPGPMAALAVAATGYLCGSIPFGFLAARSRGVDIRKVGSGNIGATNVKRACGPFIGRCVLLLDIAKGLLPTMFLAPLVISSLDGNVDAAPAARALCAFMCIAGHNWPVWLGFKGGKGVAVTIGAFGALIGWWIFPPLALWAALAKITGYVSVAAVALGVAVAVAAGALAASGRVDMSAAVAALVAAGMIALRHRENIARLRAGTEPRRGTTMDVPVREAGPAIDADGSNEEGTEEP